MNFKLYQPNAYDRSTARKALLFIVVYLGFAYCLVKFTLFTLITVAIVVLITMIYLAFAPLKKK